MESLKAELDAVMSKLADQEGDLEKMLQKRERLKEEIRKKKSKAEKIRAHKLIVFAAAFFSNFRESAKNQILDYPDTELEKVANVVFRVYSQSLKKK